MSSGLGGLAQVVHVTDDLAQARDLFAEVFAGICCYEGYSPHEKRNASIYAIANFTIEPMSPSDEPGAGEYSVGGPPQVRSRPRVDRHLHILATPTS